MRCEVDDGTSTGATTSRRAHARADQNSHAAHASIRSVLQKVGCGSRSSARLTSSGTRASGEASKVSIEPHPSLRSAMSTPQSFPKVLSERK